MSLLDRFVRAVLGCPECGRYADKTEVVSSSVHRHEDRFCPNGHHWVIDTQKQSDGTWRQVAADVNEDGG